MDISQSNIITWMKSAQGAVVVSAGLILIALVENSRWVPWSPFFFLYALLSLAIPLWLKTYQFGWISAVKWWHWVLGIVTAILLQIMGGVFFGILVPGIASTFSGSDSGLSDPMISIGTALEAMLGAAAAQYGLLEENVEDWYLLFIFLWAGVGEELYFRGYLYGTLRLSQEWEKASWISAGFFGLRHATQLFFLWPAYPFWAALSLVVFAIGFGFLMNYLYEKTRSLYLPVFIHVVFNAFPLIAP